MKKKIVLLVICILLVVLLIISMLHKGSNYSLKEESEYLQNLYSKNDRVSNCVNDNSEECATVIPGNYAIYTFKEDIPEVKEMIKRLNQENQEQKQEDQSHLTVGDQDCESVKNKYKYRYLTTTMMEYLEYKDDLISFAQDSRRIDYCLGKETVTTKVHVYSKKQKKFLTTPEEYFDAFFYSKSEIDEIIVKYEKKINNKDIDVSKIVDYKLLYNTYSQMIIMYKLDGSDEWFYAQNAE